MELYYQILGATLAHAMQEPAGKAIVESVSYQALQKIRDILKDDALTDKDCFHRIEEIVSVFEEIGSDGGSRHDFG